MTGKFVPTWYYTNRKPEEYENIGFVAGPLMEWCHSCGTSHVYPAKKNCPKSEPQAGRE